MLRLFYCFLLLSCTAAAEQYVISTYAGGAALPVPAPATAGSIGAPISVTTDSAGNIYFASPDTGYVSRLDVNGLLTRVAGTGIPGYSGDGGPATSARLSLLFGNAAAVSAGLAVDSQGNLFIADTGNHRIRRVSPDGTITTVAGNGMRGFSGDGGPATDAQLNYPWGVAVDTAGNLFIVDALNYRVRKVSANGIITTVAGGGTVPGASAEGQPAISAQITVWAAAVDGEGNLFIADNGSVTPSPRGPFGNGIRKISPSGTMTTVADSPFVWSVAVDRAGSLFVADSMSRIRKIAADGAITVVAGTDASRFSGDGGPATNAQLAFPAGVAVDRSGNVIIADRANFQIRKVAGGRIATIAGNGTGSIWPFGGPATDGVPATMTQLSRPSGVASDRNGNLFIADTFNNRIRRVSREGVITTIAGTGDPGFSGDGGPATSAKLYLPISVALDQGGQLFVLEIGRGDQGRVRKISQDGIITTVAGNGNGGFSGDNGPATGAAFGSFNECNSACGGIAVDRAGNLYIADVGNARVRKVSTDGIITTVAGNGAIGQTGDGGPATEAQLGYAPVGVAVDRAGNLFIAVDNRIRKVSPDGIITTVVGGQFSFIYAIALDEAGNLYFSNPGWNVFTGDAGNYPSDHRIFKLSADGIIRTVAGTGQQDYTGDGGPAVTATLNGPLGLALDGEGNIYIADAFNHAVRVLRPTGRSTLIGSIVDAASQRADAISPGKIVTVYGTGLGPAQPVQNQPRNGVLGTELAGTKVSFNGIGAPILYTSNTQLAAIVPYALSGTTAAVTVSYQGETSAEFTVPVVASAPSLFTLNQAGWGQAAAINAVDGTVNTAANPVKAGGSISLYATGEGQTDSISAGPIPPVRATVGGIPATVQYAAGAPGQVAGLMQLNVQIPGNVQPGGYVPIVLQVGDRSSSTAVWIAVSQN